MSRLTVGVLAIMSLAAFLLTASVGHAAPITTRPPSTQKPTNTPRPTSTPKVAEVRTPKPTNTERPTRTPLPPEAGPPFTKDHITAQCEVIPKDPGLIHVTLILVNDSGAPITDVRPGAVDIQGDWIVDRSPNGLNELPTGHTTRFSWTLLGAGDLPVINLSATFSDPTGAHKNTGPVPCQ